MAKERDASREVFWRRALRRRAASGLTIAEFCENEGLTPTAYQYWQREIKRRDVEASSAGEDAECEPAFAAVQLVDDGRAAASVEIVAGNGYVIRVGEQATSEQVRRVLQAVNELC